MASKILLADDSITIQKVVNLTFADEGIDVVAVSNGEMAERRMAEINPDLVLADIFMPGKNGYELCEFIKQSPQFRNIPVVLLVGAFEPFDQVEARRVHADAHLTKPFESRTLVETVRKLISNSGRPITTPLASPSPTDEERESSRPVPNTGGLPDTRPLPPPSFSIDLNAMTDEWPPQEAQQDKAAAPAPDAGSQGEADRIDTFPLDASVFGDRLEDPALDIQMDSPEQESDSSFNSSAAFSSETAAQGRSAESLTFDKSPSTLDDDSDPFKNLFSSPGEGAPIETTRWQQERAQPAPAPVGAEDNDQFMVVDFERPESQEQADRGLLSFDLSTGAASDSGPGDTFEFTSDGYETTALQAPANTIDPNHVASSLDAESGGFEIRGSGPAFAERPYEQASPGALFAVDDPLGDILEDESADEPVQLQSQEAEAPVPFSVESSNDPLNIEVAPPVPSTYSWDQGFDLPPASAGANEELSLGDSPLSGEFTATFDTREPEMAPGKPGVEEGVFTSEMMLDSSPASEATTEIDFSRDNQGSEWSEPATGFEFSDSAFHPIDQDEAEPVSRREETFTTSAMWSQQEARTPSIDIEATSVEEPSHHAGEPGASLSSSPEETRAENQETRPASGALELSPALIEEIVRRVVAQMSDSVVKEIAWEVVPDCVERVVENLTRESLSKNH